MIHKLKFDKLSVILVDFVDGAEGFLYLRMVGPETAVNAIWGKLVSNDDRGKKWSSSVKVPIPGQETQGVAAEKGVNYRVMRSRIRNGMLDLALIHPALTVIEDTETKFYILTYETGVPAGFFSRLNKSLSIPLKPEWELWLWQLGRASQSFKVLENKTHWSFHGAVECLEVVTKTETPIKRFSGLGSASCYIVFCAGSYKMAWLQLIRDKLNLGVRLRKTARSAEDYSYLNGKWSAHPNEQGWVLHQNNNPLMQASSLDHLLVQAQTATGIYFILDEGGI